MKITASMLFAGDKHVSGDQHCYYCGASCDETNRTKDYVKDTFTNRDIVLYPNSECVCVGCVMSLGDGTGDMPLVDGTVKAFTTPRGMAPRMYSWLLGSNVRLAFTKAHIATVREILTTPALLPEPPFAVVITDSGQKQLIFRTPISLSKDAYRVRLEEEIIDVIPQALAERLELASKISRAIGKPVLSEDATVATYISAVKGGVIKDLRAWEPIRGEPLSRLAAWLAPPKDKPKEKEKE